MLAKKECIIIGGGIAGLVAALYLRRFRREALIIDTLESRARMIPLTHNCPGFIQGISGIDLLALLTQQAKLYGTFIYQDRVQEIHKVDKKEFLIVTDKCKLLTKKVLLATGVKDFSINIEGLELAQGKSLIRYCPICDGYEAINKNIAVIGKDQHGLNECFFLKTYTKNITFYKIGKGILGNLKQSGIKAITTPIARIKIVNEQQCVVELVNKAKEFFDAIYLALGIYPQTSLIANLGIMSDKQGYLLVDCHQETSVKGIFAAGDVVKGLSQITVAFGQAAIAATAIHNQLLKLT